METEPHVAELKSASERQAAGTQARQYQTALLVHGWGAANQITWKRYETY